MDKSNYYTIGEIAKICDVNVRTLHYYDSINLVKPKFISEDSNYRYYSKSQIPIINSVKRLRELRLSIKEIKKFIGKESISEKFKILSEIHHDVELEIRKLELKQMRIKNYLQNFKSSKILYNNSKNHSEIRVRKYPKKYVAYIRRGGGISKEDFHFRFSELSKMCNNNGYTMIGGMQVIFYNNYRKDNLLDNDVEICISVDKDEEIKGKVKLLDSFQGLSCFHYGSFSNIRYTYEEMLIWLKSKKYNPLGHVIENHIVDRLFTENEDEFVTEIIIPIE